jgi:hypothetical protein
MNIDYIRSALATLGLLPYYGSKTYDPPSLLTLTQTTTTISVPGARMGDYVIVTFSLDLQGLTLSGYVSASDIVTAVLENGTAGTLDLASGTLKARLTKK